MKMVYIANIRIPTEKAHGQQIMKTCEAFAREGVDVQLIVPTRRNRAFLNIDSFAYYEVLKNFTITKLSSIDPVGLMRLPQGIYIKAQAILFLFSLGWYCACMGKKEREKSIAYTRDEYLLPLLLKFFPHVVWEAHTVPSRTQAYLSYWKKCKKIISISHGLRDELVRRGVPEEKITISPDGVDLKQFQTVGQKTETRERLGMPPNAQIVLYAGHLYAWKGVQTLADAAQYLDKDTQIFFLGGTQHDVQEFAAKNHSHANIRILGQKPYRSVPQYLHAADLLIIPNTRVYQKSEHFTSPLKVFEAMASGTPIIASDLPSLREVLNECNAFLVPPDDASSLAQMITYAFAHADEAGQKAKQAFNDASRYTWTNRARLIISSFAS